MAVRSMLKIVADLDNLIGPKLQGGCGDPSHCYYFKIKCERCMDVTKREVCLSFDVVTGDCKKSVNLLKRCRECHKKRYHYG